MLTKFHGYTVYNKFGGMYFSATSVRKASDYATLMTIYIWVTLHYGENM